MNILLADDHEVVRRGLRQILAEELATGTETLRFGEAGSAAEVLDCLREDRWDLVILDIKMPGRSGLDVLGEMLARQPGLRVLMLSMAWERDFAMRALKGGAAGYLSKETVATELLGAVRKILAGGHFINAAVAEQLAAAIASPAAREPHELLSERERQVLCLIANGHSVKEIAAELSVSEKTVFTYRDRMREKLQLRNDADLTRYALRHGLIP